MMNANLQLLLLLILVCISIVHCLHLKHLHEGVNSPAVKQRQTSGQYEHPLDRSLKNALTLIRQRRQMLPYLYSSGASRHPADKRQLEQVMDIGSVTDMDFEDSQDNAIEQQAAYDVLARKISQILDNLRADDDMPLKERRVLVKRNNKSSVSAVDSRKAVKKQSTSKAHTSTTSKRLTSKPVSTGLVHSTVSAKKIASNKQTNKGVSKPTKVLEKNKGSATSERIQDAKVARAAFLKNSQRQKKIAKGSHVTKISSGKKVMDEINAIFGHKKPKHPKLSLVKRSAIPDLLEEDALNEDGQLSDDEILEREDPEKNTGNKIMDQVDAIFGHHSPQYPKLNVKAKRSEAIPDLLEDTLNDDLIINDDDILDETPLKVTEDNESPTPDWLRKEYYKNLARTLSVMRKKRNSDYDEQQRENDEDLFQVLEEVPLIERLEVEEDDIQTVDQTPTPIFEDITGIFERGNTIEDQETTNVAAKEPIAEPKDKKTNDIDNQDDNQESDDLLLRTVQIVVTEPPLSDVKDIMVKDEEIESLVEDDNRDSDTNLEGDVLEVNAMKRKKKKRSTPSFFGKIDRQKYDSEDEASSDGTDIGIQISAQDEQDRFRDIDSKLQTIEEALLSDALYIIKEDLGKGLPVNDQDKVTNRLSAAYDLEGMRLALGDLRETMDKLQHEEQQADSISDDIVEQPVAIEKKSQQRRGDTSCPSLNTLVSNCFALRDLIPIAFLRKEITMACNWHEVCYTCGEAFGLLASDCDTGFLEQSRLACDGSQACEAASKVVLEPLRQRRVFYSKQAQSVCYEHRCISDYLVQTSR